MGFTSPHLLGLALALPLLAGLAVLLYHRRRRRVAEHLGGHALWLRLLGSDLRRFPRRRAVLVVGGAAALGLAAAGPWWGEEEGARGRGLELVMVLDASNSMLVEDVSPNRLEVQRTAAYRMMEELRTDRVGVVVFAGRAFVLSPLTEDVGVIRLYLDTVEPQIVTQTGSSLSLALRQGANLLLGGTGGGDRVLVVLSDGEALEERAGVLDEARRAAEGGIVLHTLTIGTEMGGRVPDVDPATGERRGYKREPTGEEAVSRADPALMRRIAAEGGGVAVHLGGGGSLGPLLRELRQASRAPLDGPAEEGRRLRWWWFAAISLLLLSIDAFAEARAGRRGGEGRSA